MSDHGFSQINWKNSPMLSDCEKTSEKDLTYLGSFGLPGLGLFKSAPFSVPLAHALLNTLSHSELFAANITI